MAYGSVVHLTWKQTLADAGQSRRKVSYKSFTVSGQCLTKVVLHGLSSLENPGHNVPTFAFTCRNSCSSFSSSLSPSPFLASPSLHLPVPTTETPWSEGEASNSRSLFCLPLAAQTNKAPPKSITRQGRVPGPENDQLLGRKGAGAQRRLAVQEVHKHF